MSFEIEKLNGKREPLADRLPLKHPLSISVTVANVCNLKCEYCAISEKSHKRNKPFMDMETYCMFIDSMDRCGWCLKQIIMVGLGEPMLNHSLTDFVAYAKERNIADKIHLVTNGTLLTHELTDKLLKAGLDVLRVSLNGLSSEDFLRYTGVSIDFDNLLDNLTYFYNYKGENVKSYIKIMDYMVDSEEKKNRFRKIFEPIADVVNIEYLTQMSTTLDYSAVGDFTATKGLKGFAANTAVVCPLPFYHNYFNAEGTISACCVAGPWYTPPALQMGDIREHEVDDILNGEKFRSFHLKMLQEGRENADPVCKACKAYASYIYPEDVIDSEAKNIVERLLKMHN